MKIIRNIQIALSCFFFIATGCVEEDLAGRPAPSRQTVRVELNFKIPNPHTPETGTQADAEGYHTLTWYVAQNKQGDKPLIGAESQRNPTNAPADALLMQLWAQHDTNAANYATYHIYVGNNNTSNFDVEAKKELVLISILQKPLLATSATTGFSPLLATSYWGTAETVATNAFSLNAITGRIGEGNKVSKHRIRCIRDITP